MEPVHVVILVLYLAIMIGVGAWFSRKKVMATGDDYLFAGRSLPRPVMIGTLLATWVGSGTIIGGASFAYTYGPLASIFFLAGTPVGIIVLYFLVKRIRRLGTYTVPQLLEQRYGLTVRILAAIITVLAYVGITAYQFTGGGLILGVIAPISATDGAIIMALVVTFLAVSGGLKSVAWTDFLSAVVIVVCLMVTLPLVLGVEIGGWENYWSGLSADAQTLSGGLSAIQLLGYFLPLFLLILADQNMYQRFGAAKNEKEARSSAAGFFFTSFLVTAPVALLGSASAMLFPDIVPDNAVLMLSEVLPLVFGGLLLAGTLAFIITTGSSFILSGASNIVYDVVQRMFGKELEEKQRLWTHRTTVLAIGIIAYVLGRYFPQVLELQMYSYTVYGVAIAPPVLAMFFWKRASTVGALTSMALGGVVTIVWEQMGQPYEVNAVIVSLPVAVISLIVVSLLVPNRSKPDSSSVEAEMDSGTSEPSAQNET